MDYEYRAWHYSLNKMIRVCSIDFCAGEVQEYGDSTHKKYCYNNQKMVLMQFTFMVDKNYKKIYEGDIVKLGSEDCFVIERFQCLWVLRWDQDVGDNLKVVQRDRLLHHFAPREMEVVGNIYQNPELMNENPTS